MRTAFFIQEIAPFSNVIQQLNTIAIFTAASANHICQGDQNAVKMKRFTPYQIKRDITQTFFVSLLLSISVFGWLRLMFFDFPFSFMDEAADLATTVVTYWALILGIKLFLNLALLFIDRIRKPGSIKAAISPARTAAVLLLFVSAFVSCNVPPTGIKKDFNTGMVTKYSGLVPAKVNMVMNGEELHHADIPLGESFTIVNENIQGFIVRDGKVSVGCALKITDTAGKELLNEPDLFIEHPTFQPDSARTLRCLVNTGQPMNWDQNYAVTVVFWDKFGTGKIENATRISMIDKP